MDPSLSLRERCFERILQHPSRREREGPALEERGRVRGYRPLRRPLPSRSSRRPASA